MGRSWEASVAAKARRLVTEGRVTEVTDRVRSFLVEGDSGDYVVTAMEVGDGHAIKCPCEATDPNCSHARSVRKILYPLAPVPDDPFEGLT